MAYKYKDIHTFWDIYILYNNSDDFWYTGQCLQILLDVRNILLNKYTIKQRKEQQIPIYMLCIWRKLSYFKICKWILLSL